MSFTEQDSDVRESDAPESDVQPASSVAAGETSPDQPAARGAAPESRREPAVGVHSDTSECIELRRLHRFFGDTRAVNDVTFSVGRGQVFGYIGPNGAGKTTSMRILATLDLPSYGDAFVDGFSVVNDPELVRKRLGFMPDSFGTYRDVNCREYLDFFARAYGLVGRQRTRRLQWVLDFTGTSGMAAKPIRGLSKGMKQRLCLGRALVHDPAVMILDEPAAGLDPRARIELRRMIRELADRGKTILISSHILTELAEMCDAVGIIEQGRLLATGSVDQIQAETQNRSELTVRILNRHDEIITCLSGLDENIPIDNPILDGQFVRFGFSGNMADQAAIVTHFVTHGFHVAEVNAHKKSLEDLFLQVTEGLVQ
ncbi:putative ABC transporter ATP-binding protein YbhF [Stieleria maiorica]|uniref:Putative ABC transporter ATP-binding protein YbhF n=1 Tax=Stieleria maiorica TaxID=2795974 RepID=A0A5B9MIE9_9BACT|nr:ABC transporter ATP-binding protein [Stieleria maiorica]QEG00684.1 putative ABC transporter ATP-binding protein YbhF [Stieleria maiorica]